MEGSRRKDPFSPLQKTRSISARGKRNMTGKISQAFQQHYMKLSKNFILIFLFSSGQDPFPPRAKKKKSKKDKKSKEKKGYKIPKKARTVSNWEAIKGKYFIS